MKDKYKLTIEQNIFLAKKQLVENIYCSAKLEGLNTTFPETQTILDGVNIPSITLDDITTILNLRDAWRFVMKTAQDELVPEYICKINEHISRNESLEWGTLRKGNVGISGTDYIPAIPTEEKVAEEIGKILRAEVSHTEKALKMFAYITRSQLFWDGNKRTATLAANKILIMNGAGIFKIKEVSIPAFNKHLTDYYNSGNDEKLLNFLYDDCIYGLTIE
ncbi:MAG: Fic family protein [Chitinivibrionia bacterium]|nr:Fic family protein [Chitinivibrionia bacterium]